MSKYSPTHYQRGYIEVWDFIEDQDLDYFLGNVIKYVCRAGYKPDEHMLEDLKKAKTYLAIVIVLSLLPIKNLGKYIEIPMQKAAKMICEGANRLNGSMSFN